MADERRLTSRAQAAQSVPDGAGLARSPEDGALGAQLIGQIDAELARWAAAGRRSRLWVRDDDAVRDGAALRRLRDLASTAGVAVSLAVIPARLEHSLLDAVDGWEGLEVVQHGFAHVNHSEVGVKKAEFGAGRSVAAARAEIEAGRAVLAARFGARFVPAFVPPWNRIDESIVTQLPAAGIRGLSTFKPRQQAEPAPGLRQVNCHVDVIDWRGSRGFAGAAVCVAALLAQLARERQRPGRAADPEPLGVLTHHAVHDTATWRFLAALFSWLAADPRVQFLTASEVFAA